MATSATGVAAQTRPIPPELETFVQYVTFQMLHADKSVSPAARDDLARRIAGIEAQSPKLRTAGFSLNIGSTGRHIVFTIFPADGASSFGTLTNKEKACASFYINAAFSLMRACVSMWLRDFPEPSVGATFQPDANTMTARAHPPPAGAIGLGYRALDPRTQSDLV